jgi:hypothetical protein
MRSYTVTPPSGVALAVSARTPHDAAVAAVKVTRSDGLVVAPDARDSGRARWEVRLAGWDFPCWLYILRCEDQT